MMIHLVEYGRGYAFDWLGKVSIANIVFNRARQGSIGLVTYGVACMRSSWIGCSIRNIAYIDHRAVIQVLVATALPALYFYFPKLGPFYIPTVCGSLALLIMQKAWDDALKEAKIAELSKTIERQNSHYKDLYQELVHATQKLEDVVANGLGTAQKLESLDSNQDVLEHTLEHLETKNKERIDKLKKEIEEIALLWKNSHPDSLVESMRAAKEANKQLTELTVACAKRQQELKQLNSDVDGLQQQLKSVTEQLSQSDHILHEKLVELEKFLGKQRKE